MKGERISSSGDPFIFATPTAASSAGTSSPVVPMNVGSMDWLGHVQGSKAVGLLPCMKLPLLLHEQTYSSLACARRGWVNVDIDKIEYESCGVNLEFIAAASWTSTQAESAGEGFAKQLDGWHNTNCPWRGNSCAESLVQFPPPSSALIGGFYSWGFLLEDRHHAKNGEHQRRGHLFIFSWPPNGESNYEETVEFDPIEHHNHLGEWKCSYSSASSSSASAIALVAGSLDDLDAFQ